VLQALLKKQQAPAEADEDKAKKEARATAAAAAAAGEHEHESRNSSFTGSYLPAMLPTAFSDFEDSGILKEHILADNLGMCGRFAFIGGRLNWCGGASRSERKYWEAALKSLNDLPEIAAQDAIWNICYEDMAFCPRNKAKGLYVSKASHPAAWDIAAPDWEFLAAHNGVPNWPDRLKDISIGAEEAGAFEDRNSSVFFRGKDTGRDWPIDRFPGAGHEEKHFKLNPRYGVYKRANTSTPEGVKYDVHCGIHAWYADSAEVAGCGSGGKGYISRREHCKYKYLLAMSGRGTQGTRLKEIMACGSLSFMHSSPHVESFYHLIVPWTHVIPYASDASDLDKVVDWAQLHPSGAAKIAMNGRKLINDHIGADYFKRYWVEFIREFNRLKQFKMDEVTGSCEAV
jgi:hypothetical protein